VRPDARTIVSAAGLCAASIILFYFMNLGNRRAVEARTVDLAVAEGDTIEKVLKQASAQLLAGGEEPLVRFLDEIFSDPQVVYVALRSSGELRHAASKFEGYLPLQEASPPVRVFPSPLGEILEVSALLRDAAGRDFQVHIGYFFSALDEIRRSARRSLLLLTLLQSGIVLLLALFLSRFNRQMRRQELEVQREKEEKEKLREISLVTAGINHEIRNPLHSLYLSYQLLEPRLDPADPEAAAHGRALKREIKRIQDIIERFSQLTRDLPVRREEIDPAAFFSERRTAWEGLGAGLRIAVDLEAGVTLFSDRGLLAQVLDNLARNAAEAGARGLDVSLRRERGRVEIRVRDDGPGITAEQLNSIFDPFVSFKPRGSGIGLALARRIVLQLGGRIDAASVEGRGAVFTLTL
jgi:signal transduction histidine kinase